jgi:hypothetical protein
MALRHNPSKHKPLKVKIDDRTRAAVLAMLDISEEGSATLAQVVDHMNRINIRLQRREVTPYASVLKRVLEDLCVTGQVRIVFKDEVEAWEVVRT